MKNLFRTATVVPRVHIGDVTANVDEIRKLYKEYRYNADVVVTPELSLTGYTCGDLFCNRRLLNRAKEGLLELAALTTGQELIGDGVYRQSDIEPAALVVGIPYEIDGDLYNCAAFLANGQVIALVPKVFLPNYGEFYEKRWFSEGFVKNRELTLPDGSSTIFGNDIVINYGNSGKNVKLGIEVCEDVWTPLSPSRLLAMNGAEVILNLSASNEVIGKEQYRRNLISSVSASCICGYVYVSAGKYESTSDIVFSGHSLVYENGKLLGEVKPFEDGSLLKDINLAKIRHDRIANKSFAASKKQWVEDDKYITVKCERDFPEREDILARVSITPFVPGHSRLERAKSIFRMQVAGLERRLEATHAACIVVGVSGGLDSTLALLVSAQAVKNLGLPSKTLIGITMPGFGTTGRTKGNSHKLMELLGCDIREISIVDSVRQHFADIGHDEEIKDVTYENCQARERTQILMDVANKSGGFVIGTGDLSELALGWCTYNGDHMSMYAVNTSIPKTLVRTLVDMIGHDMDENGFAGLAPVIEDIIDTPVSPELLPPNPDGTIAQKTEDTVGSYVLHDFFLYYTLRYGMEPDEIRELTREAVRQSDEYKFSDEEIDKWLKVFYTRFFRQQFKRNCMPDGVKVGSVSVSPRGDLRLPSEIEFEDFV